MTYRGTSHSVVPARSTTALTRQTSQDVSCFDPSQPPGQQARHIPRARWLARSPLLVAVVLVAVVLVATGLGLI